jgi:hypothetical protein
MHWLKQKKASKNTRIPDPLEQAEKTVGEAYDRAAAQSTNFSSPFSLGMHEWHLCPVRTIPARSHPNPRECPFLVSRAEISNGAPVCAAKSPTRILPSISDGSINMSM